MTLCRTVGVAFIFVMTALIATGCLQAPAGNGRRMSSWRGGLPAPMASRSPGKNQTTLLSPSQPGLPHAVSDNYSGNAPADLTDFVVVANTSPTIAAPQAARSARLYCVRKGDTLALIARRFYGDTKVWKNIYQANMNTISNPNVLEPGITIQLP